MTDAGATWSLARATFRQAVLAVMLPLLGALAIGYGFLSHSLSVRLQALVREELNEATLRAISRGGALETLPAIAEECQREHPDYPMVWRVWDSHSRELLALVGAKGAIRRVSAMQEPTEEVALLDDGFATSASPFGSGRILSLVLDGASSHRILRTYLYASAAVFLTSLVLALAFGYASSRRVRRLFARVASEITRDSEDADRPRAGAGDLPEEVYWVARELRASLQTVREESNESVLFTMCLAHELRSPIQNLIGQIEVALMNAPESAAHRSLLQRNLDESLRFCDAIDNLLSICSSIHRRRAQSTGSSADAGADEEFDLWREARVRLQREVARGERRNVTVELSRSGECSMRGDREAAVRGLRNIAANAVDWSPGGGRVRVEFAGGPSSIVVSVEDEGPGIPTELRDKIFEPFFRGETNGERRTGFGLGLSMAREAARMHSGSVRVEPKDGRGTRIVLELARNRASRPEE